MRRWFLAWLVVLACLVPGALLGDDAKSPPGADAAQVASDTPPGNIDEDYHLVQTLIDVIDQVERHYVKKVDRKQLLQAAINGVLSKLDPYSTYIPPENVEHFRETLDSEFGGIGIYLGEEHGQIKVITPIMGSPAYRAGVRAGDKIVEINGQPTKGLTSGEATVRLKGKSGTEVTFTVVHAGESEPVKITVKREVVQLETVMGDSRREDDSWDFFLDHERRIGYVRMTAFTKDTTRRLRQTVEQLEKDGLEGLILDLRFNPGGLLSAAIDTCDLFLEKGTIVSTTDRDGRKVAYEAKGPGTCADVPLAVLVNGASASASEVVSACLQDNERAVVVGERTFGKGLVQNVMELPSGGALKMSTSTYYRPSGKNIQRDPKAKADDDWGVLPSEGYAVPLSDSQMVEMMRVRFQRDVVRFLSETQAPTEDPTVSYLDPQLQKALDYVLAEATKRGVKEGQ